MWKSTSELGHSLRNIAWTFVNFHAIEQTQLRRQHRDDGVGRLVNFHAIEQTQLRRQHRDDGVGRLKFDFHTGARHQKPVEQGSVVEHEDAALVLREV